ncbi:hypothetical protein CEXT_48701 [Caerostris extrusa]|uniref:Maturase K n=1 Tax=Caerostris extrusa TaxID=172846 RepID=A0AAV4NQ22_CAEEX|nr:hypothetical protein CEXT_48701 [Caerostris extrusa]
MQYYAVEEPLPDRSYLIPCVKRVRVAVLRYLRYGTKLHQPQSIRRVLSLYRKNEKKNHSLEKYLNGSIKKISSEDLRCFIFPLILKSAWFISAYY